MFLAYLAKTKGQSISTSSADIIFFWCQVKRTRIFLRLEKGFKNLTRPATLHFLCPVLIIITTANGSVNKPA
jgi:hypothetical protein